MGQVMEILVAVAVLLPLIILLLLTLAVTVQFFWLAHQGRWPPDLQSASADERRAVPRSPEGRKAPASGPAGEGRSGRSTGTAIGGGS